MFNIFKQKARYKELSDKIDGLKSDVEFGNKMLADILNLISERDPETMKKKAAENVKQMMESLKNLPGFKDNPVIDQIINNIEGVKDDARSQ